MSSLTPSRLNGRNVHLRVNTNGMIEPYMPHIQGQQQQANLSDPFISPSANGNVTTNPNGYALTLPSPPPGYLCMSYDHYKAILDHVKFLENQTSQLRTMGKDSDTAVEGETDGNGTNGTPTGSAGGFVPNVATTPNVSNNGSSFANGLESSSPLICTPQQGIDSLLARAAFGGVPLTPTTPSTPFATFGSGNSGNMHSSGGSIHTVRYRHRRTQTPTQSAIRRMTGGIPLYTVGIDRQCDRGLLGDFFEGIRDWAREHTLKSSILSADEIEGVGHPGSVVYGFLGKTENILSLLDDDTMRCELVAGIVTNHIAASTLCDKFLQGLGIPEAAEIEKLIEDFHRLGDDPGKSLIKHELLLRQKALYTTIKTKNSHRKWRAEKAKELACEVIEKLGVLASNEFADDRDHNLQELYIKGLRIGFRMRMDPEKWIMEWYNGGVDFDPSCMVNESRFLHGDAMRTIQVTTRSPHNYKVLFAVSPMIYKLDFHTGVERREGIHNAMVYLVRKPDQFAVEDHHKKQPAFAFGSPPTSRTPRRF